MRAACAEQQKKYMLVAEDCQMALQLYPAYTEAWQRLARVELSLGHHNAAITALRGAMASLPWTGLSEDMQKQKREAHEKAIMEVKACWAAEVEWMYKRVRPWAVPSIDQPARRSLEFLTEVVSDGRHTHTSFWILIWSYAGIHTAVSGLWMLNQVPLRPPPIPGVMQTLECFALAVVRDGRAWHILSDIAQNILKEQASFEVTSANGWAAASAHRILKEAAERIFVSSQTWVQVRSALTVTTCAYILEAVEAHERYGNPDSAVIYYGNVIELMDGVRELPLGIPEDDRGLFFHRRTGRNVRALRIAAFMEAHAIHPDEFPIQTLQQHAQALLTEVATDLNMVGVDGPCFMAFFTYPAAKAYAALGFCECRLAKQAMAGTANMANHPIDAWMRGAVLYQRAATDLPDDEELKHAYLNEALKAYWHGQATLGKTLPLLLQIEAGLPGMKRLWENSMWALEGGLADLEESLSFLGDVRMMLNNGSATLDSVIKPSWL
ncbi:hypothetical protein CALCODRAFT_553666 [Calocera cornea HHB12733]|uniref:Uncharacterized protein n=1 Tax=Calocera cornea HHB12733 TaxID=1353952 RepID=A0A165ICD3_9BASI|nr:hypothetical protein CALCODRAFT_553666 [Calocera cornea HHB12733]